MNRVEAWGISIGLLLLILMLPPKFFGRLSWLAVSIAIAISVLLLAVMPRWG